MRVVVRQHRPLQRVLLATLMLVALCAGAWTVLKHEREAFTEQIDALKAQQLRLGDDNRRLAAERDRLSRKIARIERASQIEAQAYAHVDTHLSALQAELQAAKEEVSFYQGIMAQSDAVGVRIQRFDVEAGASPGHFRFRLVLTRGLKDDTVLEGTVALAVEGELGSKPKRLEHSDAVPTSATPIPFKFRHFQRIEDELVLPDGFVPRSVTVQVRIGDKKSSGLEESFAWPS